MTDETRDAGVTRPQTEISIKVGDSTVKFEHPKLYTLSDFLANYGEDNCTIMLQDREQFLYSTRAVELLNDITGPDRMENVQIALNAWKPCDDRPPTEAERLASAMLALPPQEQAVVRRHIDAGIEARNKEAAEKQAEVAAKSIEKLNEKYTPKEPVGPPVTQFQKEPQLESFEDQGRISDEAVKAAQTSQEPAIAENLQDYAAPTEFEDGSAGGVVIEQPPQIPFPRDSS